MKARTVMRTFLTIVICIAIIVCLYVIKRIEQPEPVPSGFYRVTYVIDGDTIEIDMDGSKEKIRLIGVDTPETHHPNKGVECFGQAASDFTKAALDGEVVRVEADETNQNRDRYQRLLRYVYTKQGRLWNAELLREGYAHALLRFPFTKMNEFEALETQAREQNKGLWSACR